MLFSFRMRRSQYDVLKGQPHSSPGHSEATPWVNDLKMNSSLFLFSVGGAGGKQETGKWNGWAGSPGRRSPRPLPWATMLLPPLGRQAEPADAGNSRPGV